MVWYTFSYKKFLLIPFSELEIRDFLIHHFNINDIHIFFMYWKLTITPPWSTIHMTKNTNDTFMFTSAGSDRTVHTAQHSHHNNTESHFYGLRETSKEGQSWH